MDDIDRRILDILQRHTAVGDVDVLGTDIDVVKKGLEHPAVIALQPIALEAVIFVEVEGDDAREVEPFFAMQSNEFAIDADGGRTGRQSQHGVLTKRVSLADQIGDRLRHQSGDIDVRVEPVTRDFGAGNPAGTLCVRRGYAGGHAHLLKWRNAVVRPQQCRSI